MNLPPGTIVGGFAFAQFDGTVFWDRAGVVSRTAQPGQRFDSQRQWEAAERMRSRPLTPPAVQSVLSIDAARRDESQVQLLRRYFIEYVFTKTRDTFLPLHAERAAQTKKLKEVEAEVLGNPSFAEFVGKWIVYYDHGVVREYILHEDGRVEEPSAMRESRLIAGDAPWLLEFDDGKIERLRFFTTHEARVEHYNPASALGSGEFLPGIARRRITVRSP
jgi:hypothetical protein